MKSAVVVVVMMALSMVDARPKTMGTSRVILSMELLEWPRSALRGDLRSVDYGAPSFTGRKMKDSRRLFFDNGFGMRVKDRRSKRAGHKVGQSRPDKYGQYL
eukprot:Em0022g898a